MPDCLFAFVLDYPKQQRDRYEKQLINAVLDDGIFAILCDCTITPEKEDANQQTDHHRLR